jgi:hypothetical protein
VLLRNLALRWMERNRKLTCPHCRRPASAETFKRGRYLLAQEELVCELCHEVSPVAFWRYHGLSDPTDGSLPLASRRRPIRRELQATSEHTACGDQQAAT